MPIINNNNKNDEPEKDVKKGIISSPSVATNSFTPEIPVGNQTGNGGAKFVVYGISFLLVVAVAVIAYMNFSTIKQMITPSASEGPLVSLEVKRMVRIGGLIDLVEKKIIQTRVSMEQAEKLGDKVVSDTFKLQLARSLNELETYQDDYISGLINIHGYYEEAPDDVIAHLKAAITDNRDAYKLGNTKAVTHIKKLITSVKSGEEAAPYFIQQIKN